MKKLALRRVLREIEDDLEKWSSNLETLPVERTIQKGATTAMPVDVQKVWGGPKLEDDDLPPVGYRPGEIDDPYVSKTKMTPDDLAARYNLNNNELERISVGDFSGVHQKVGDLANFAEDVADVFGKYTADKAAQFTPKIPPNAPMKLGPMYDRIHRQTKTQPKPTQATVQPTSNTNHNIPMAHAPTQITDPNINSVRPTPPELNPTKPKIRTPQNR